MSWAYSLHPVCCTQSICFADFWLTLSVFHYCVIKEYHWKMVRKAHVRKIQVVKGVGTKGRTNYFSFSLSSPSFPHPTTLWFIGEAPWLLQFWGSCWESSSSSWSTFLQLCRYRQVLRDKSFSAAICVFVLCTTFLFQMVLISSELSLVQKTVTENVTEHSLSFEHKTPQ